MKSRSKLAAAALLLLLLASVGVYLVVVPLIVSKQYANRVYAAARPLEASFRSLGESTELPLLTDPSAPAAVRENNADQIARLASDARQKVDSLKQANDTFRPLPYVYLAGQYRGAEVLHKRTRRLVEQSEDALDSYLSLAVYLEVFNKAADNAVLELDEFNTVSDLNVYAGQSEALRQIASKVRRGTTPISDSQHPGDVEALSVAAVKALQEVADGFDDLAYGLAIPADNSIYAAAHKIEEATRQMDALRGEMYTENVQQSRVVKDIQDLPEKLELVLAIQGY